MINSHNQHLCRNPACTGNKIQDPRQNRPKNGKINQLFLTNRSNWGKSPQISIPEHLKLTKQARPRWENVVKSTNQARKQGKTHRPRRLKNRKKWMRPRWGNWGNWGTWTTQKKKSRNGDDSSESVDSTITKKHKIDELKYEKRTLGP